MGAVAYFDHRLLLEAPGIDRNDDGLDRPGPFVCVQVRGNRSVWCAITGEERPERLLIAQEWRRDGSDTWRDAPQYLQDGLNTYLGPTDSFIAAASLERSFRPFRRPWITPEGVLAIIDEINRQGGPLEPAE